MTTLKLFVCVSMILAVDGARFRSILSGNETSKSDTVLSSNSLSPCGCIDIVIIIDSTQSVGPKNFDKIKLFVSDFILSEDNIGSIELDSVRVAVFSSNTQVVHEVQFEELTSNAQLQQAVGEWKHHTEVSNSDRTLRHAQSLLLKHGRAGAASTIIWFTDGYQQIGNSPYNVANELRASGTQLVCVGIPGIYGPLSPINFDELAKIAGSKDMVVDGTNLFKARVEIQNLLKCDRVNNCPATTAPTESNCNPADIIFVVETSVRIGQIGSSFHAVKQIIQDLFPSNKTNNFRTAFVHYSNHDGRTGVLFDQTAIQTADRLNSLIDHQLENIEEIIGVSDLDFGIQTVLDRVMAQTLIPADPSRPKFVVFVGSGFFDSSANCCKDPFSTGTLSKLLSQLTSSFAIGAGQHTVSNNLLMIAGGDETHVTSTIPATYASIGQMIKKSVCG